MHLFSGHMKLVSLLMFVSLLGFQISIAERLCNLLESKLGCNNSLHAPHFHSDFKLNLSLKNLAKERNPFTQIRCRHVNSDFDPTFTLNFGRFNTV